MYIKRSEDGHLQICNFVEIPAGLDISHRRQKKRIISCAICNFINYEINIFFLCMLKQKKVLEQQALFIPPYS